jgi:hypothetical protein
MYGAQPHPSLAQAPQQGRPGAAAGSPGNAVMSGLPGSSGLAPESGQQPMQGQMQAPVGQDGPPPQPAWQQSRDSFVRAIEQQAGIPVAKMPPAMQQRVLQSAQENYKQEVEDWKNNLQVWKAKTEIADKEQFHADTEGDKALSRDIQTQNHADSMALRQATLQLAQSGLADRGWTVVTGKDGKIYRVNAGQNKVELMADAPQGMARLGQNTGPKTAMGMLMQKWREEHPNFSVEDMQDFMAENTAIMSAEKTLATSSVTTDKVGNELTNITPIVSELSSKVSRTNYPTVNKLIEAAKTGSGDTDVIRLGIAVNSVRDLYAKYLNGNGQSTDSARAQASEMLDKAWATNQIDAAVDQINKEVGRAKLGIAQTRRDLTSRPGDTGLPRIRPDTDDYAKLPSGAEYIAPDGSHRRKS